MSPQPVHVRPRDLVNRVTVRGAAALVALLTLAIFSRRSDPTFVALVLGAAIVVAGATDLAARTPAQRRSRAWWLRGALEVAVGLAIALWPSVSMEALGRLGAVALISLGAVDVLTAALRRAGDAGPWLLTRGLATIGVGAVTGLWPTEIGHLVLVVVGLAWVAVAAIDVIDALRRPELDRGPALQRDRQVEVVATWLRGRELDRDDRERLDAKLFFEGAAFRARLSRYAVLLGLSALIATLGVLTDSTAVVIGAMLVSPLMTPIMACASALVSGQPARAVQAALLVAGGTIGAITLAFLATRLLPVFESVTANSQITSRVEPTVMDLLIALAAGAAGAFAMSREDVSDSLPGVAIAVALVPPLAVVGVTLQAGDYSGASGALLLFLTNLVAIILAGGLVFVLAGVIPVEQLRQQQRRVRVYAATVVLGVIIVLIPLAITGQDLGSSIVAQGEAEDVVESWLADRDDTDVVGVSVSGSHVDVAVVGEGEPPAGEDLAAEMSEALGEDVTVDLRWIPEVRERFTTAPTS